MVYLPNIYVSTPILLHYQCPVLMTLQLTLLLVVQVIFCYYLSGRFLQTEIIKLENERC